MPDYPEHDLPAGGGPISDAPRLEPIHIVTTRSDYELAKELKNQMSEALKPILDLMNAANRAGMRVEMALGVNGYGQNIVNNLTISKPLT